MGFYISRAMGMLSAILTSKSKITIPVKIRQFLDLKPGDKINFIIQDGQIIISKAKPLDELYNQVISASLNEWSSSEDDEAYKNL